MRWSTLKSASLGLSSDSSLPPLIGGWVVAWSVSLSGRQKRRLPILMEKQSTDRIDLHPLPIRLPVSLNWPPGHGR